MEEIKEDLIEFGVDLDRTLERFLYKEDLYIKFLKKFLNDSNFDGIKNSLQQKDYQQAFNFAHTLKGVTANLGLEPIYHICDELVEELRKNTPPNNAFIEKELNTLEIQYDKIREIIIQI